MKKLATLLLLALAAPISAQVEFPAAPVEALPGKLTQLIIKNIPADVAWQIVPAKGIEVFREFDEDTKIIKLRFEAQTGTYFLIVSTANAVAPKVRQQICVISVGSVAPPVDPPSKVTLAHVSYFGNTGATKENAVIGDPALRNFFTTAGAKLHVYTKDGVLVSNPTESAPDTLLSAAKVVGIPCVILQDKNGAILASATITNVADVKKLATPFMGGK